jgi:pantoate--beta-alanine ligase
MLTIKTAQELRTAIGQWRNAGERIGFVPTMGNLHAGHLHLVDVAREYADRIVVSIFVNPTQFGKNEDIDSYPRTIDEDRRRLVENDVDLLFLPGVEDIYPDGPEKASRIEVPGLGDILEGEFRPGHFSGVATVVEKLFNLVQPHVAVFGEKDFQQLAVIHRMVQDLNIPVEIISVPTVRESDGLAMSSRNTYLTVDERREAPILYATLKKMQSDLEYGDTDFKKMEENAVKSLKNAGFTPDYVRICRVVDLLPATTKDRELVILAAARLGKARLIDNLLVTMPISN